MDSFERFAGACSLAVAFGALAFAAIFAVIVGGSSQGKPFFALLLGGAILIIPVLVAIFRRLRVGDEGFALTAFLFGLLGALGGILHGGYELGALQTPSAATYYPGPEAVTKGVLRYGCAGLALLLVGWLIVRHGRLPRLLGYVGLFGGGLLVLIYFGRLYDFITPASHTSLIPPFLYGFVVHPIFYGALGLILWRDGRRPVVAAPPAAAD
jgi:Domain of unknown function (DUF4386)